MHRTALDARSWIGIAIIPAYLLLAVTTGCGSAKSIHAGTPPVNTQAPNTSELELALVEAGLPTPSALKRPSYVDSETFHSGDQFGLSWQNWNVRKAADFCAAYTPGYTPVGPGTSPAFGIYYFTGLDTFDHQSTLHLNWAQTADYADCWVGLADFGRDSWRWYSVSDSNAVNFDAEACIDEDYTYAVVLLTGDQPWLLSSIYLGSSQPPFITGVSPVVGIESDAFNISATLNIDPAEVSTWSWQFSGGIAPGASSDPSPMIGMPAEGIYQCSVRATNAFGESDYNFAITVNPPSAAYHREAVAHVGDIGGPTAIVVEPDGEETPHIVFADIDSGELWHAYLAGGTWHKQVVATAFEFYTSNSMLAVDSSGALHLVYSIDNRLYYAYNEQGVWHNMTIDDGDHPYWVRNFRCPSLALDGSGLPHVSYLKREFGDDYDASAVEYRAFDGTSWSAPTEIVYTGGLMIWPTLSEFCPLDIDVAGNPCIVYHDYESDELHYVYRDGTWEDEVVGILEDARGGVMEISTATNSPKILVWAEDGVTGAIYYARYLVDSWEITNIGLPYDADHSVSLTINDTAKSYLCNFNVSNRDLMCAIHNGLTWPSETVDTTGEVGVYCDITLDSLDVQHISYFDLTNEYVKYARFIPE